MPVLISADRRAPEKRRHKSRHISFGPLGHAANRCFDAKRARRALHAIHVVYAARAKEFTPLVLEGLPSFREPRDQSHRRNAANIVSADGRQVSCLEENLAAAAEAAGAIALIIDTDPQATASQWGAWRADKAPEVIDSAPPRIQVKVEATKGQGATFIVIDTPPHADSAASRAVEVADLVLIPCRPSAFDLAAIQTTDSLVHLFDKPAYVVFTAGPPHAPRMYDEAADLVQCFGIEACPHILPDRAVYRHASAAGASVIEFEPGGKAASEIAALQSWTIAHVNTS